MLSISDSAKAAFLSGNPKTITLKFDDNTILTNENIIQESMTLTQTITDTQNFSLGQIFSSEFRIQIFNDGTSYAGKWFNVTLGVLSYSLKIGRFKVESEKTSDDRIYKEIVAYDAIHDILSTDYAEWHNGLTFPMSLSSYIGKFTNYTGINLLTSGSFVNNSMIIQRKAFITGSYSGADVLRCILELNGCFACVSAIIDNSLYVREINPTVRQATVSNDNILLGGFKREDFVTAQITCVHVRTIDGVTSGSYPSTVSAGKTYYITNNPLVVDMNSSQLATVARNILGKINQLFFHPYTLNCIGMPWMEVGDVIEVRAGQYYGLPIFNRVLSGINALRDTYTANGTKQFTQTTSGNITVQTTT